MKKFAITDAELVKMYKEGNEDAFEQLVNRHSNKIFTTIYMIVKDRYLAEDLLQETFIKAVNTIKSGRYNEEGKFLPWISRVAHNMAIDHFRKSKRYPTITMEDGSSVFETIEFSESNAEDLQIKQENHKMVRELIKKLPKTQREVLIMRHYAKMSFQEIAEATDVSINTALGRMRYALINMKKYLDQTQVKYDKNNYQ